MYYRAIGYPSRLEKGEALRFSRSIPLRQEAERLMTMNEAHQSQGAGTPPKPRRSGSERRQKGRIVPFRVSATEYAELDALAEREGLSIGSYVRSRVLTVPTTRAIRRPVVEVELLTSLLGQLHKIGSNINQTARRVNMGDTPLAAEIQSTLAACRQIARQVTDILNRSGTK